MTEVEWLACTEARPMLGFLLEKAKDRQVRLFACAIVRRLWHLLADERSRQVILSAERFADGLEDADQWRAAYLAATHATDVAMSVAAADGTASNMAVYYAASVAMEAADSQARDVLVFDVADNACVAAGYHAEKDDPASGDAVARQECREQASLLRCIFGNPFRPVAADSRCLTPTVQQLARAAYDKRLLPSGELDPQRLAVLAGALEEAQGGAELLDHLREPGPHVRGCWVVDALLGNT